VDRRAQLTLAGVAAAIAVAVAAFGKPPNTRAPVTTPEDDREVIATLPVPANDPRRREIRDLRRTLDRDPSNERAAVRLARLDILLARERADPRYLGHAQAALAPWWSRSDASPSVLVLRATIEQSLHDFDAALLDLERALALAPGDVQAWLTKATVLTVCARYAEAREACAAVQRLGATFPALVCDAQIDGVTGGARAAGERLERALARAAQGQGETAWGLSLLGELAERAGDAKRAETSYQQALALDPEDAYTRGAYADLLLDEGRPREAITLLRDSESNDGLLLRLALAETRAKDPSASRHLEALSARFAASRARGDVVHRREEARFWLSLGGDPRRALTLAKENFVVQKEPWDVRVLLEAAAAAGQPREAGAALEHVARTKLEGPSIARARAALGGAPSPAASSP
jgi:tetratricopeptide (TPR) repeat protein